MTSDRPQRTGSIFKAADDAKAIRLAGYICLAAALLRGVSYLLVWAELSGPGGRSMSIKGYEDTSAFAYIFIFFLGFAGVQAIRSQTKSARGSVMFWGVAAAGWSVYNTMQITSDGRDLMTEVPEAVFRGGTGLWVYCASGLVALFASFVAFRARRRGVDLLDSAPPPVTPKG